MLKYMLLAITFKNIILKHQSASLRGIRKFTFATFVVGNIFEVFDV